jgi:hypothetical protein
LFLALQFTQLLLDALEHSLLFEWGEEGQDVVSPVVAREEGFAIQGFDFEDSELVAHRPGLEHCWHGEFVLAGKQDHQFDFFVEEPVEAKVVFGGAAGRVGAIASFDLHVAKDAVRAAGKKVATGIVDFGLFDIEPFRNTSGAEKLAGNQAGGPSKEEFERYVVILRHTIEVLRGRKKSQKNFAELAQASGGNARGGEGWA